MISHENMAVVFLPIASLPFYYYYYYYHQYYYHEKCPLLPKPP